MTPSPLRMRLYLRTESWLILRRWLGAVARQMFHDLLDSVNIIGKTGIKKLKLFQYFQFKKTGICALIKNNLAKRFGKGLNLK